MEIGHYRLLSTVKHSSQVAWHFLENKHYPFYAYWTWTAILLRDIKSCPNIIYIIPLKPLFAKLKRYMLNNLVLTTLVIMRLRFWIDTIISKCCNRLFSLAPIILHSIERRDLYIIFRKKCGQIKYDYKSCESFVLYMYPC